MLFVPCDCVGGGGVWGWQSLGIGYWCKISETYIYFGPGPEARARAQARARARARARVRALSVLLEPL
jgi:hypothetical protein